MLKQYMQWQSLSQQALADRSGVSRPQIQRILAGRHNNCHLGTVDKLAGALGVAPMNLLVTEYNGDQH